MDDIISNKFYLFLLGINIIIVFVNYSNLNNPRPYPPKKNREEFKRGRIRLSTSKYIGFSHYSLPRLAKSESNWIDGYAYWNKACIKLGIVGIIVTLFIKVLRETFDLYTPLVGAFIILTPLMVGMIWVSYKMEKNILKD